MSTTSLYQNFQYIVRHPYYESYSKVATLLNLALQKYEKLWNVHKNRSDFTFFQTIFIKHHLFEHWISRVCLLFGIYFVCFNGCIPINVENSATTKMENLIIRVWSSNMECIMFVVLIRRWVSPLKLRSTFFSQWDGDSILDRSQATKQRILQWLSGRFMGILPSQELCQNVSISLLNWISRMKCDYILSPVVWR